MLCIEEILQKQRALNVAMGDPMRATGHPVKENLLALIVEATEALNEIHWKPWKPYPGPADEVRDRNHHKINAFLIEMTDILQFWSNAITEAGFSAADVEVALRQKWVENNRRVAAGEVTRGS